MTIKLVSAGAEFLPFAGNYTGNRFTMLTLVAGTSHKSHFDDDAYAVSFNDSHLYSNSWRDRYIGWSVRLVRPAD